MASEEREPGGKLRGLVQLAVPWVPPFFPIDSEFYTRYSAAQPSGSPLLDLLTPAEKHELQHKLTMFGSVPEDVTLIVRSNGASERLEHRGLLKSFRCDATLGGVLGAAEEVFKAASQAHPNFPVGLIVQLYCSPILAGHLSNERRLAEESRRWFCETCPPTGAPSESLPKIEAFRVERCPPATGQALNCSNQRELIHRLRCVGRYFHDRKQRRHLEWVWDGDRLWIVQNDDAPDEQGNSPEPPPEALGRPVRADKLSVLRVFKKSDAKRWQKLECVQLFKDAGLPTTSLFILAGRETIQRLAEGKSARGLLSDLRELTKAPLVIRTDIEGKTTLYAPRTDGVSTPEAALQFLRSSSRALIHKGVRPARICFIAHRFIPAAASAFSLATPTANRVRIDALWGLPDGLEFCSHDSFEVDAKHGTVLARRVRHKGNFLAALADGSWKVTPLAAPWDWKPSLDADMLRRIAKASHQLARELKKSVISMWFCRVPEETGHPPLIPWRYTEEDAPRQVDSAVGSHFRSRPFYIRNEQDVAELGESADQPSAVVLRPDGPHLRDESFLTQLGTVVRQRNLRIDLEGSPLSHAYYVLQRAGAQVACVDPIDPKAVRRKFEKLVRDRVPIQIQRHGERAETLVLPRDELLDVLKAKIVEEALEVLRATSSQELQEEMADVFEVLRALCRTIQRSTAQLERDADRKRKKLGGFGSGIVLVETEDMPLVAVRGQDKLFDPGKSRIATLPPKSVVAAGRRLKTQHDRIVIPLIPAVPSRFRGSNQIHFRNLGLTFRVVYKEKVVEIVLQKEPPPVSPAQMILPLHKE